MNVPPSASERPSPASVLRPVHVGLREDLEVSRHLFRGEVSYIVRDPLTFQSQRLDLADYDIFVNIDANQSLSAIFDDLVGRGKLTADDEERFYQFVMSLHRLGFLRLPLADDRLLYRRYQMRERARRRERLLGVMFLRLPLWNPDACLDRTMHLVRPLFGRTALCLWLLIVGSALFVAVRQWGEVVKPLHGILAAQNLPLMWVTLIVLKFFHEMGHAYACKHFGGHVPEMGAYLIVLTPCAYMDASSAWTFPHKYQRLAVSLAGMYVEAMIAAVAVYVWSMTGPSLVHALAYNVMFLASVVTVLFNINPLMRYDGYYILSDLTGVPNLRQRSTRYVLDLLKRPLLGLPSTPERGGWRLHLLLAGYGIAVSVYRVFLFLAIAAILVAKMGVAGFAVAVLFLGGLAVNMLSRLTGYLWHAEETRPVRRRAVVVGVLGLIVLPATLAFAPVPSFVRASAVITGEQETVVRVATAGFLERVGVERGQTVDTGMSLVDLANDAVMEEIAAAQAKLTVSHIRRDAYRVDDPARSLQEEALLRAHRRVLGDALKRLADLHVPVPLAGRVTACLEPSDVGSFIEAGTAVATIVAGRWQVRAVLTEDQMAQAQPRVGQAVAFRAAGGPSRMSVGVIARIAPAGSRAVPIASLTHLGGGDIVVNPLTREAAEPYFEVTIDLPPDAPATLRHGMTGLVRLPAGAEPVVKSVARRFVRFWNRMLQG